MHASAGPRLLRFAGREKRLPGLLLRLVLPHVRLARRVRLRLRLLREPGAHAAAPSAPAGRRVRRRLRGDRRGRLRDARLDSAVRLLVAAAFGFAYLVVLQIPFLLFAMVWVLLASVLIILVAAAALAAATARDWAAEDPPAHSERELQVMRALAAVLVVASALYACLLVALRKRITLAIGILKEAARALTTMPALALLPVVQCAGLARPGAEVSARRVIGRRPRRSSSSRSGSSTPPTWPPRASSRRATSNITARRSPTRNSNTRGTSGGPPSTSCSAGSGRASSSSRWGSSSWRARSSSGISRETRQRRRS